VFAKDHHIVRKPNQLSEFLIKVSKTLACPRDAFSMDYAGLTRAGLRSGRLFWSIVCAPACRIY
jgi:hypothetical protein